MKKKQRNKIRKEISQTVSGMFHRKGTQAIRKGLIFMTPLAIISSFALVLLNFPIPVYQQWMQSESTFFIREVLSLVYGATVNCFSLVHRLFPNSD